MQVLLAVHDVATALHVLLHGQLSVAVLLVQFSELPRPVPLGSCRRRRCSRSGGGLVSIRLLPVRRLLGLLLERGFLPEFLRRSVVTGVRHGRLPVLVGRQLLAANGALRLAGLAEAAGEVILLGVAVTWLVALRPGGAGELAVARELVRTGELARQALVPVPPGHGAPVRPHGHGDNEGQDDNPEKQAAHGAAPLECCPSSVTPAALPAAGFGGSQRTLARTHRNARAKDRTRRRTFCRDAVAGGLVAQAAQHPWHEVFPRPYQVAAPCLAPGPGRQRLGLQGFQ